MDKKESGLSRPMVVKAINALLKGEHTDSEENIPERILSYNGRVMVTWESNPQLKYPTEADIDKQITETQYPDIPITDSKRVRKILRSGSRHYVLLKTEAILEDYLKHVSNAASTNFEFYTVHNDHPFLVSVEPLKSKPQNRFQ